MYTMYFNVVVGVVYLEMFCEGCTLVHRYIPRNILWGMYLGTQVYTYRNCLWQVYLEMFCEGCTLVHRYIPRNVLWHIPVAFLGIPAQVYLEMPQVCTLCSLMPLWSYYIYVLPTLWGYTLGTKAFTSCCSYQLFALALWRENAHATLQMTQSCQRA